MKNGKYTLLAAGISGILILIGSVTAAYINISNNKNAPTTNTSNNSNSNINYGVQENSGNIINNFNESTRYELSRSKWTVYRADTIEFELISYPVNHINDIKCKWNIEPDSIMSKSVSNGSGCKVFLSVPNKDLNSNGHTIPISVSVEARKGNDLMYRSPNHPFLIYDQVKPNSY